jgi:ankyrin repeat protein
MWAVEKGRDCVIKYGLSNGINIENVDNNGWNAMMYAAKRGNMSVVNSFLEYGGDLNQSSNSDNLTALHLAASGNLIEMCMVLLKAGANPNIKSHDGKKAIDYITDRRDREKYSDCLSDTYKEGKTPQRLHQEREERSIDKSLNKAMELIQKAAVEDIYQLTKDGEESRMELL